MWNASELGATCMFESPAGFWFPQLGFKLVVLESGQPNGLYHAENQQEAFLLLSGECRLLTVGERCGNEQLRYPVSELAARYGASVEEETSDAEQAYARFEQGRRERPANWDRLPWA